MLGVDGDHGDARPRARFGGDGVHIQVTPTVRPRCHGQFPLFCSFPGLQILPGFQIDLVDLNTPRPKTPVFPIPAPSLDCCDHTAKRVPKSSNAPH